MTAILDVSDRIARMTDGNAATHFWYKDVDVTSNIFVAGQWSSLWTMTGKPGAGAAPGASAIPTRSTAGAMSMINPGGARQRWMLQSAVGGNLDGVICIYDRLFHCSGLVGNITTVQTPNAAALTRYTTGAGNRMFVEYYTAPTSAAGTVTAVVNYVNQAGSAATSPSFTFAATGVWTPTSGLIVEVPFADGDSGCRSITSIQLSNVTGQTAGNFGLTIGHPLVELPCTSSVNEFTSLAILEDVEIQTDACLWLIGNFAVVPAASYMAGCYMMGEK
jgi:hypothetical protein